MDSYFEILLYVGPHSSFISGLGEAVVAEGTKQTLEGRTLGWEAPEGWDQRVGQTHESSCPAWGSLSSHPYSSFTEPSLCTSEA